MLDLASYCVIQTINRTVFHVTSARKGQVIYLALLLCATCFGQLSNRIPPTSLGVTFNGETVPSECASMYPSGRVIHITLCNGAILGLDDNESMSGDLEMLCVHGKLAKGKTEAYVSKTRWEREDCHNSFGGLTATFSPKPDAPQPQPKPANLFTFRKSWQDPPLRANKQVFKSPVFLLSQSAMILSMVVACRNKHSLETWESEAPAVGALFGMDYLSDRFFSEYFAVGPAIYATIHYMRAARK